MLYIIIFYKVLFNMFTPLQRSFVFLCAVVHFTIINLVNISIAEIEDLKILNRYQGQQIDVVHQKELK